MNFVNYLLDFYGPEGLYPLKPALKKEAAEAAASLVMAPAFYKAKGWEGEFCGDSVDREACRDLLIEVFGYQFPEAPLNLDLREEEAA